MKWTNRGPRGDLGPAGVSWRGPINWGLFGPKRARKGCAAVGPGAPRGGPPLAAALAGGGAGSEAHVVDSAGVPGGMPGLAQGALQVDIAGNEVAIVCRPSGCRLRTTWQALVGRWADAGGRRGPRGGGLTSNVMRAQAVASGREMVGYSAAGRRGRMWLARGLMKTAVRAAR